MYHINIRIKIFSKKKQDQDQDQITLNFCNGKTDLEVLWTHNFSSEK